MVKYLMKTRNKIGGSSGIFTIIDELFVAFVEYLVKMCLQVKIWLGLQMVGLRASFTNIATAA